MSKVKASKQHRMIVVRYRPVLTWVIRIALCAVFFSVAIGGYTFGFKQGANKQQLLELSLAQQQKKALALEIERNALTQELMNTKTGADIDRQANEAVRQEVLTLRTTLQKTQEENTFYRNIMNPPKGQKGPAIGRWQINSSGVARQYDFKLVVKQLGKQTNWVKGRTQIIFSGLDNTGQTKQYDYKTLAALVEGPQNNDPVALNVRFRYFQTLTGSFKLPKNFTPQQITINLIVTQGKDTQTITKTVDW